ncbi:Gfo/Idh/MocA family oxidoreductase [bacterium]|nr:Gfo/Idh/MocA family oxidoreductase [bacterium]
MSPLRTAVVGVGALGRHHLRWLSRLPESQLVGLYDTDRSKAERYADEYKVQAFEKLDDLAGNVDAVSVVVPTTAHYEVGSFLIENGIHCLIEKPITPDLQEASELHDKAHKKGVKVTVGQIERFNPAVLALADLDIRPSFIEAHRLAPFDPRGTDVAVVLDLMIHDIDLVLHLIKSELVDIQASAVAVVSDRADIANARLTFANGAVANLTASRISLHAMRKLRIFQKSGYYSLDLAKKEADLYRLAGPGDNGEGLRVPLGKSDQNLLYQKVADSGKDMLGTELQTFLNAIIDNKPVAVTLAEATDALKVALDIQRIGLASIERMIAAENA